MPFGSPLAVSASTIAHITPAKMPAKPLQERQPAWKPSHVRGKGRDQVHLVIREYIRAVQYDDEDVLDTCELNGAGSSMQSTLAPCSLPALPSSLPRTRARSLSFVSRVCLELGRLQPAGTHCGVWAGAWHLPCHTQALWSARPIWRAAQRFRSLSSQRLGWRR